VRAIAALRASPGSPAGVDQRAVRTLQTCVVLAELRRSTRSVAERLHDAVAFDALAHPGYRAARHIERDAVGR